MANNNRSSTSTSNLSNPSGGGQSGYNKAFAREALARGFNSFDDNNTLSGFIDEKELLDLEHMNSPHIHGITASPGYLGGGTGPALNQSSASHGFSATPPQSIHNNGGGNNFSSAHQPPLYAGNPNLHFSATPPVPESTSPFDEFMFPKGGVKLNSQSAQQAIWSQRHKQQQQQQQTQNNPASTNIYGMSQYGMRRISSPPPSGGDLRSNLSPQHALRVFQDYGVNSNTSSPVESLGSLDAYGMSPSAKPPVKMASSLGHSLDDKQQLLLAERRRRRRESHNAVERRRRDNINDKIQELASLVPDSLLYSLDSVGSPNGGSGNPATANLTKDGKPNKGTILSRSVDYIRHLQAVIDDQNRRELEMQDLIQSLQRQAGQDVTPFTHTSAELALAKFRGTFVEGGPDPLGDVVLSPDSGSSYQIAPRRASASGFTPDYDIYSP